MKGQAARITEVPEIGMPVLGIFKDHPSYIGKRLNRPIASHVLSKRFVPSAKFQRRIREQDMQRVSCEMTFNGRLSL